MKVHPLYPDAVLLETDEEAEAAERLVRKAPPGKSMLESTTPARVLAEKIRREMK